LLYHRLNHTQVPDYVQIHRSDFEVVTLRYKKLLEEGHKPFTTPFQSMESFLGLFADMPDLQDTLAKAFEETVEEFNANDRALITPVEQTLHRAPVLVSSSSEGGSVYSLWLLGDAAVGLPVSKGCNLVYHMASAGKLVSALLRGGDHADYEDFVFSNWHREAWKARASKGSSGQVSNLFAFPLTEGRFTS